MKKCQENSFQNQSTILKFPNLRVKASISCQLFNLHFLIVGKKPQTILHQREKRTAVALKVNQGTGIMRDLNF